ncbi:hypothetical protein P0J01_004082 [Vibrio parahaemolyticus]|nr:hypothetical protein [Vibrio parahaemolyticus]EHK9582594.1 hypothetical protein [Vibrio parahaemolyticus]EIZ1899970.1 hypothetical protein [Vibrio parahaemolyticus]EKO5158805.1 hypothetical protein [Vibrio parahaemolyticus]
MSKTNPFPQRLKQARNRVGISQRELGVPVAFFFSDSDSSAELACLIEKLSETKKQALIEQIRLELDKIDQ